jgi:hypothetical protein
LQAKWPDLQAAYDLRRLKGDIFDASGAYWHVEATPAQLLLTDSHVAAAKLIAIGGNARQLTKDGLMKVLNNG